MGKTKTHIRRTKLMVEEKLIESVRKRPFLYIKSHPHHGNRIMAACVWKKIYEEIGTNDIVSSGDDCADLWGSIWAQYLAFKRKVERGSLSESGKRVYFRHEIAMRECIEGQKGPESIASIDIDGPEVPTTQDEEAESSSEDEEAFQQYSNLSSCSALSSLENNNSPWKPVGGGANVRVPNDINYASSTNNNNNNSLPETETINQPETCFPSQSLLSVGMSSASNSSNASAPPSYKYFVEPQRKRLASDWPDEPINLTTKPASSVLTSSMDECDLFGATIAAKLRKINRVDSKGAAELMFKIHEIIYFTERSLEFGS